MIIKTDSIFKFRGFDIFIRNKKTSYSKTKILYCMGSTYHTDAYFDMSINGFSAMDHLARSGFDVYCYDMLGLGQSARPKEEDPAIAGFGTLDGVELIEQIYDYISQDGVEPHVIGYSWGTIGTMVLASRRKIPSLTLLGARYPTESSLSRKLTEEQIASIYPYSTLPGFYRVADCNEIKNEWLGSYSTEQRDKIINPKVVDEFFKQMLKTEVNDDIRNSGKFKTPIFPKNDIKNFIFGKLNFVNAKDIKCPCQVICAPDEMQQSQEIYSKLVTDKDYTLIPNSTHWGLIENNRSMMLNKITNFIKKHKI